MTVFQNLFPPIQVQSMRLSQARRVVLLSYNAHSDTIEWRHFLVSIRPVGVSRTVRRVIEGTNKGGVANANNSKNDSGVAAPSSKRQGKSLPNLGNVGDISEYVLGRSRAGSVGAASDTDLSEAESEIEDMNDPNNTVELFQRYIGRGNADASGEQRAVRLREVGPRIELKLMKIEDGMAGGETLYHNRVTKTARETAEQKRAKAEKDKVRQERKAKQEANVQKKKEEKEARRAKGRAEQRGAGGDGDDGEEDPEAGDADDDAAAASSDDDEFAYEDRVAGDAGDDGAAADLFNEDADADDYGFGGDDDEDVSLDEGGSDGEDIDDSDDAGDDSDDDVADKPLPKLKPSANNGKKKARRA